MLGEFGIRNIDLRTQEGSVVVVEPFNDELGINIDRIGAVYSGLIIYFRGSIVNFIPDTRDPEDYWCGKRVGFGSPRKRTHVPYAKPGEPSCEFKLKWRPLSPLEMLAHVAD